MYTAYRHWDVVWPQCHESVLRHKRTWKWEIYFDMIIYLHALLEKVEDFERISMSSMILLSKRTIKNLTTQWIRSIWRRKKKQNIPKLKTAKKITNEKRLFFCFLNEFTTEFSHSLTLLCFDTFVFQQCLAFIVQRFVSNLGNYFLILKKFYLFFCLFIFLLLQMVSRCKTRMLPPMIQLYDFYESQ